MSENVQKTAVQFIPGTSHKKPVEPAPSAQLDQNPYLPPEILQMVFCNLGFFNLIRCQHVCRHWKGAIDGAPKLRDKLFINRQITFGEDGEDDEDEDGDEDGDEDDDDEGDEFKNSYHSNFKGSSHWLTKCKGRIQIDSDNGSDSELSELSDLSDEQDIQGEEKGQDEEEDEGKHQEAQECQDEEEEEGQDEEQEQEQDQGQEQGQEQKQEEEEADIPTLNINLKAHTHVLTRKNFDPLLYMALEIDFDYHQDGRSNEDNVLNFAKRTRFHPMLKDIEKYMHLVDENFEIKDDKNSKESEPYFQFDTFKELGEKMVNTIPRGPDGGWKDELLCVPAVRRVDVVFTYRAYVDEGRKFKLVARRRGGVTMGQFVEALREQLAHAESDWRNFSDNLVPRCDDCGESLYVY